MKARGPLAPHPLPAGAPGDARERAPTPSAPFPRPSPWARALGTVGVSARVAAKEYLADPLWVLEITLAPLAYAMIAVLIFAGRGLDDLALFAVLGSALMGMWAATLWGTGQAINFERWQGTLEYSFASPADMRLVMVGRAMTNGVLGAMTLAVVFVWTSWFLGRPITIGHPEAFLFALALTLVSFAGLGILLACLFVLTREAMAWANSLEDFVFLMSGLLFPIAILPEFTRPVSYALSPTWGIAAIRRAGSVEPLDLGGFAFDLGIMLLLAAGYGMLAVWAFSRVERKAREEGSLGRY